MFTGIVEKLGHVLSRTGESLALTLSGWSDLEIGESISINGCCLTLTRIETIEAGDDTVSVSFSLSPETLSRTNLGDLRPGNIVNLERAMRADGRFGGHFVQGHVDATAEIVHIESGESSTVVTYRIPAEYARFVIDKGSVCLDGISLTAIRPSNGQFSVAVIPHTLANTNLQAKRQGDQVNLEVDVLARYVERLILHPHS